MKRDNPWLFQRMVRIGLVSPTVPVYVFSEEAGEQVAQLNKSFSPKMFDLAPYPHDEFAIEMTCRANSEEFFDHPMRTLAIVSIFPEDFKKAIFGPNAPPDVLRLILEVEAFNGTTVILPDILSPSQGTFIPMTDLTDSAQLLRQTYMRRKKLIGSTAADGLLKKYNIKTTDFDDPIFGSFYKKRSGETVSFLTSACAIMASPVVTTESAKRSGRAPPLPGDRKDRERTVETKWTHVGIDLDRHAAPSADDGEAQRNGVALHPVRAHLRVTQHGISPVRAHMRGDAIYGIRHRVGVVNKSGR